jgi:acetate---CoA ligase (ADP-forming)
MLVDLAEAAGVPFANLLPETRQEIKSVLEPGLEPANPLDAWGTGNSSDTIYQTCSLAMDADPNSGLTLLAVDMMRASTMPPTYPQIVLPIRERFKKPLAFLANVTAAAGEDQLEQLRAGGIPVLMGTETGLRAIKHLLEYSRYQDRREALWEPSPRNSPEHLPDLRKRLLEAAGPFGENQSRPFLEAYGIPVVPARIASDLPSVLQAARSLGFPVAIKTDGDSIHKTELGGVALDLRSEAECEAAYLEISGRLGPRVSLQPMVPAGVELLLGLVHDPQFGPLLSLGAGGIFAEILGESQLHALPTNTLRLREAFDAMRIASLLSGARGRPAADLEALYSAVLGLAALAEDLGDCIQELDINPLIAGPAGVVAVDVLIIPRSAENGHI